MELGLECSVEVSWWDLKLLKVGGLKGGCGHLGTTQRTSTVSVSWESASFKKLLVSYDS